MEKGNKDSINKKINYILLAISLILIVFSIWAWLTRPLKIETLNARFIVGKTMGFSIDSNELNFGRITPGGAAERNVNIEQRYGYPVNVKIFVSGNIADFVFAEPEIIAFPGNNTKIPIVLKVPENTPLGNYTGEIKFEFRRAYF